MICQWFDAATHQNSPIGLLPVRFFFLRGSQPETPARHWIVSYFCLEHNYVCGVFWAIGLCVFSLCLCVCYNAEYAGACLCLWNRKNGYPDWLKTHSKQKYLPIQTRTTSRSLNTTLIHLFKCLQKYSSHLLDFQGNKLFTLTQNYWNLWRHTNFVSISVYVQGVRI